MRPPAEGSPLRLIMIMIAGALGVALAAGCQSPRPVGVPSPAAVARIFIAGDSIASIYPDTFRPRAGWGQALPLFVSPEVRISDRAIPGASSKSYRVRGSLDQILQAIGPGDYLLIAFGHNDERDEPELHTDPGSTFESSLRAYIIGARSRGGIPILLTPVECRQFDSAGAR